MSTKFKGQTFVFCVVYVEPGIFTFTSSFAEPPENLEVWLCIFDMFEFFVIGFHRLALSVRLFPSMGSQLLEHELCGAYFSGRIGVESHWNLLPTLGPLFLRKGKNMRLRGTGQPGGFSCSEMNQDPGSRDSHQICAIDLAFGRIDRDWTDLQKLPFKRVFPHVSVAVLLWLVRQCGFSGVTKIPTDSNHHTETVPHAKQTAWHSCGKLEQSQRFDWPASGQKQLDGHLVESGLDLIHCKHCTQEITR